jgi:hypothetical protein
VKITPTEADLVPPKVSETNLDDKMKLLGYALATEEQELVLTLYWESLAEMDRDYTIFVHLVDAAGNQVAQHDAQPWWEAPIPTTTWRPNEKLRDRHTIALPPNLAPGTYHLRVGVYYWQTLERLPVLQDGSQSGDFVELGPVTLE